MGLDILIRIQMQITEGEMLDMRLKSMEQPLKLFLLHPGDEVFLILESFPYNADIKPAEIEFESHSEYWFSLEIKARKENWKVDPSLSSMLLPTVLFLKLIFQCNSTRSQLASKRSTQKLWRTEPAQNLGLIISPEMKW